MKYRILGTVAVLTIIALGFLVIKYNSLQQNKTAVNIGTSTASSTEHAISLEDAIQNGQAKITVTKVSSNSASTKASPDLSYQPTISPDLSPAAVAALNTQTASIIADLKRSPASYDDWMKLGVLAKIAGDYQRAIELWSYAAYLSPKSAEPYADMGDVYGNYLKYYAKAEMNYKIAITNNPGNLMWQQALNQLVQNSK